MEFLTGRGVGTRSKIDIMRQIIQLKIISPLASVLTAPYGDDQLDADIHDVRFLSAEYCGILLALSMMHMHKVHHRASALADLVDGSVLKFHPDTHRQRYATSERHFSHTLINITILRRSARNSQRSHGRFVRRLASGENTG